MKCWSPTLSHSLQAQCLVAGRQGTLGPGPSLLIWGPKAILRSPTTDHRSLRGTLDVPELKTQKSKRIINRFDRSTRRRMGASDEVTSKHSKSRRAVKNVNIAYFSSKMLVSYSQDERSVGRHLSLGRHRTVPLGMNMPLRPHLLSKTSIPRFVFAY